MAKSVVFLLCSVLACIAGQRITTIQLDGVQYFISRMNPYSPELNYFLAYQYCRSLGLQLASFETKEKVESMTTYLQNAGYSKYDFWTSGNRLGTGMFLWMSTGLPFNATFDSFENSADAVQAGLLDPVDHNSNTSPQRTARDSSSGLEKGCVMLKAPSLKWTPEDCSAVKDFICEQTRCYYYNYGSIPVSSAQGRPITSTTTTRAPFYSTTPLPHLFSSTFASFAKKSEEHLQDFSEPSLASLKMAHEDDVGGTDEEHDEIVKEDIIADARANTDNHHQEFVESEQDAEENHQDEEADTTEHEEGRSFNEGEKVEDEQKSGEAQDSESIEKETEQIHQQKTTEEVPPVEQRLKQISQEIEKYGSAETPETEIGHQSFLSLSDLIRTLRPNDKNIPHIDSDYSNTMRVLGETSSLVSTDESRKLKDSNSNREINRALF